MAVLRLLVLLALATALHCNASFLAPRDPCGSGFNWTCPEYDLAFYPLAPRISGEEVDPASMGNYLACYYPFVSNCQYRAVSISFICFHVRTFPN
jgi:hypothetical protein